MKKKIFKKLFGFTRLVKPFARFRFAFEPKAQSGSKTSQTKFRFAHSYGFTLAEVLITLSILGVVAAITVPSLINRNTEKQFVSKLKKEYSAVVEAFEEAIIENGGHVMSWKGITADDNGGKVLLTELSKYLNVKEKCFYDDDTCEKMSYQAWSLDGTEKTFAPKNYIILGDGALIVATVNWADCSFCGYQCGGIWFDLNGKQKPNRIGVDLFAFRLDRNGIVVQGSKYDADHQSPKGNATTILQRDCNINKKSTVNGESCAAWALYKGNMDYRRKTISW